MDKITLEFILWADAHSEDAWAAADDVELRIHLVHTYGQVIREDDNLVMVALNYVPADGGVSCVMIIPKCCIKKRYEIEGYGRSTI